MLKKLIGLGVLTVVLVYGQDAFAQSCTSDADCTDPTLPTCDSTGNCVADASGGCTSDADCTDPTLPTCDSSGTCVADASGGCTSDADCTDPTLPTCDASGTCVADTGTDACGGTCDPATEVCDEGAGVCVATDIPDGTVDIGGDCLSDADCLAGDACDPDTGLCIAGAGDGGCNSDADCDTANGEVCDVGSGACIVDPGDGTVEVGGDCLSDADCLDGDSCDAGTGLCIAGGAVDTGSFVECVDDTDCGVDEACVDDGAGGTACASITLTSTDCNTDADCASDETCVDDGTGNTVCATIGDFVVSAGCSVSTGASAPNAGGVLALGLLGLLLTFGVRRNRRR